MLEVSVVIPTRNRWRLLSRAALPAALAQEDVEFEVIVVDDASTDETPTRLAALAGEERRLRVVRQVARGGVARARNAGIRAAAGTWVAFLDDDDVWSPRKLRRQLDVADDENAEVAYSGAVMLDASWRVLEEEGPPRRDELVRELLSRNVVPAGSSNVMAAKALLERHGGFDERLYQLADWDLWLRLALDARAACVREPLVGYATHPENMVIETRSDVMQELDYLERKHAAVSEAYGARFDRLWLARWVAGSNRRAGRRLRASAVYLKAGIAHRSRRDVVRAGTVLARLLVPSFVARRLLAAKRVGRRRLPHGEPLPTRPGWLDAFPAAAGRRT